MSFKSNIVKMAIKCTPNVMVIWVANKILKGIVELIDFKFDVDGRKTYVQAQLIGEADVIEVWMENFSVLKDDAGVYSFIVQHAQSNKPWLNTVFAKIVGKTWKIPAIPKLTAYIDILAELFKAKSMEQDENVERDEA